MYQINDLIVYGAGSVCRVEAIGVPQDIPLQDEEKLYYTLRPLFDNGIIRVPVDAKVFMRPVITREQANALIESIPTLQLGKDCDAFSTQLLNEHYRTFFVSHSCEDLLTLIKTVYAKSQRATSRGRSMGRTDQRYYQRAKDLLEQEFSVALDIPLPEVGAYIAQQVEASS